MAVGEMLMARLADVAQAAQLPMQYGKTFSVAKVTTGGVGNLVVLAPAGATDVTSKLVMLKLEGAKQAMLLKPLVGKSVVLMKGPTVAGAAGKWLVLQPVATALAAGTGAKVAGTAATLGAAGIVAKGMGAKGAVVAAPGLAAKASAASSMGMGMTMSPSIGMPVVAGTGLATTSAATATGGTIWSGTGWSLGLGLGLGAWGPVLLAGLVCAAGYYTYEYVKSMRADGDEPEGDEESVKWTEMKERLRTNMNPEPAV